LIFVFEKSPSADFAVNEKSPDSAQYAVGDKKPNYAINKKPNKANLTYYQM
jgi:hypothetical protein